MSRLHRPDTVFENGRTSNVKIKQNFYKAAATNVETINVDKYGKSYSVGDINIPVLSLGDESS